MHNLKYIRILFTIEICSGIMMYQTVFMMVSKGESWYLIWCYHYDFNNNSNFHLTIHIYRFDWQGKNVYFTRICAQLWRIWYRCINTKTVLLCETSAKVVIPFYLYLITVIHFSNSFSIVKRCRRKLNFALTIIIIATKMCCAHGSCTAVTCTNIPKRYYDQGPFY